MAATDVTPDRSTPPAGGLSQIRIVDWAQRAERWVFMTNNTNPTQGASGIPLEPLHFDTFGSTRTWDPVPALVFDRWWTLPEDERNQRFEVAFKLLMDDAHSLDHDRHVALANADPEMWWAATVIGGRTLDALERLSASVDLCRQHSDLQTAWMAIETATGFFGVAVWLQKQVPLHPDPPSEWVRTLVGIHGTEPATLISEFAHASGQLVLGQCVGEVATNGGGDRAAEFVGQLQMGPRGTVVDEATTAAHPRFDVRNILWRNDP